MPKLQKVFRDALDSSQPTDKEIADDLKTIMGRVEARRESMVFRYAPMAGSGALALAAGLAIVLRTHAPSPEAHSAPTAHAASPDAVSSDNGRTMTVYLRKSGEPESSALSLTLNVREGL